MKAGMRSSFRLNLLYEMVKRSWPSALDTTSCIETLSKAGIKIWMLTVDKIGTAINISYACNLINNEMKQFIISSEIDGIRDIENTGDQVEIANFIKEEVKRELKKYHEEAHLHIVSGPKLALIIDGKCLMYALEPSCA